MESDVALARLTFRARTGRIVHEHVLLKLLEGPCIREAHVYEHVIHRNAHVPRLRAVLPEGEGRVWLVLEGIVDPEAWPWSDLTRVTQVLDVLADLHASIPDEPTRSTMSVWDYDTELLAAGRTSVALLERRDVEELASLRRHLPSLRRVTASVPVWRGQLARALPLALLHGDVHSGNVLVSRRRAHRAPVLVDWARARVGSPLEDVSAWLISLARWEPRAGQRHDTLLRHYLARRGWSTVLGPSLRGAYWLAAASNALAGALAYHLTVAVTATAREERLVAAHSASTWLRAIRRADAYLGATRTGSSEP